MQLRKTTFKIMLTIISILILAIYTPVFAQNENIDAATEVLQSFCAAASQGDLEKMNQHTTKKYSENLNIAVNWYGFLPQLSELTPLFFKYSRFEILSIKEDGANILSEVNWIAPNSYDFAEILNASIDIGDFDINSKPHVEAFIAAVEKILSSGKYPMYISKREMIMVKENDVWKIDEWYQILD